MKKRFKVGKKCVIGSGGKHAIEAILSRLPFKSRYGEEFVVVTIDTEESTSDGWYFPHKVEVQILKERVTMK